MAPNIRPVRLLPCPVHPARVICVRMTRGKRKGSARATAETQGSSGAIERTLRGFFLPEPHQLNALAARAMVGLSTVRRWYERPDRTTFGNRHRLRVAATQLGIRHPDPAPPNGRLLGGAES